MATLADTLHWWKRGYRAGAANKKSMAYGWDIEAYSQGYMAGVNARKAKTAATTDEEIEKLAYQYCISLVPKH